MIGGEEPDGLELGSRLRTRYGQAHCGSVLDVLTHLASCHGARLRGCLQVKRRTRLVAAREQVRPGEIHARTAAAAQKA